MFLTSPGEMEGSLDPSNLIGHLAQSCHNQLCHLHLLNGVNWGPLSRTVAGVGHSSLTGIQDGLPFEAEEDVTGPSSAESYGIFPAYICYSNCNWSYYLVEFSIVKHHSQWSVCLLHWKDRRDNERCGFHLSRP